MVLVNAMKALLIKSLDKKFALPLINTKRFVDQWVQLRTIIMGENTTRLVIITEKIRNVRYRGNLTKMLQYFQGLIQEYKMLNGTLSDTELANILLQALPPKYATYKLILRKESIEKNDGKFNLAEVIKLLSISEVEIRNERNDKHKKYSKDKFERKNRYHKFNEEKNKKPFKKNSKEGFVKKEKDLSLVRCYKCQEFGHYANKCMNRNANEGNNFEKKSVKDKEEKENDDLFFGNCEVNDCEELECEEDEETWLMDSGANAHATNCEENLVNKKPVKKEFYTSGNKKIIATAVGEKIIKLSETESIELKKVYFAPVRRNMISLAKLTEDDYEIKIKGDDLSLIKDQKVVANVGFIVLTDAFSRYRYFLPFKSKSSASEKIVTKLKQLMNLTGKRVKVIHTDGGTEIINEKLENFCKDFGITIEQTPAYTPQKNGVAERSNRTIVEGIRTLLSASGLSKKYWCYAAKMKVYLLNRTPHQDSNGNLFIPYEKFWGKKTTLSKLRVFGSDGYAKRLSKRKTKLENRSEKCKFIGYNTSPPSYIVLYEDGVIGLTRTLVVDEERFGNEKLNFESRINKKKKKKKLNLL